MYYVEGYEFSFYRIMSPTRIGVVDVVGINLIGSSSGTHYAFQKGLVKWRGTLPFTEAVRSYIDRLVEQDHKEFKQRWYPLLQD